MKKAKPSKGSARVRKFADGGDIAALAGLGTLAYLLSRKKGKEKEGGLKLPSDTTRKVEDATPAVLKAGMSDAERRATAASKGQPETPEEQDKSVLYSDRMAKAAPTTSKRVIAASKPAAKAVAKPVEFKQTPVTSKPSEELPSKPYPEKEAAARKAEARRRAGQGLTPREEYTGMGSRKHIEALRLARSQRLEEEAKKQFEKNKREKEKADKGMKKGGSVKKYANGGSVSQRADGIAQRGKTRGKVC
jgi:hypothetical protein